MKHRFVTLKAILSVMAVVLVLSSCAKKDDPVYVEPAETYTPPVHTTDPVNTTPTAPTYNYATLSDSLQAATYNTFISSNHEYFVINNQRNVDFDYGPNAQMLDVLTDAYQRQSAGDYLPKMKALLHGIKDQNGDTYANAFYDDMGFLSNACMRDYVLTQDAEYLTVAKQLYAQIKFGFNNTMGGGVAFVKDQPNYKNMTGTGNMCILAARLYKLQSNADDLTLAKKLYDWMKATLVIPTGVVMSGINRDNSGSVDNRIFTHNQGLFIGSAVEMYNITKDHTYLQDAILTANNALTDVNLAFNGALKSEGQGEGGLYKGVLVRYLTLLTEVGELDNTNRKLYADFLQKNARLLYYKGIARPSLMISPDWSLQPGSTTDFTTQLSGVIMMEAAARLKSEGRIE